MNPDEIAAAIEVFINAEQREAACQNLAQNGGAAAIPALIERMTTLAPAHEFQRQAYAAYALNLMGPAAVAAVPAMVELLGNAGIHDGTRKHVVRALGEIAPGSDHEQAVLAALARAAVHPNLTVRNRATEAIEKFM